MKSPQQPSKEQTNILEKAGMLQVMDKPVKMNVKNGMLNYHLSLPGQAVVLLKMEW